jgi:predicted amidophosphoribosyltransferase
MTTTPAPILCPRCGAPMNPHAEKPCEPLTREEAEAAARTLGYVIEAVHQCPKCGYIEARPE